MVQRIQLKSIDPFPCVWRAWLSRMFCPSCIGTTTYTVTAQAIVDCTSVGCFIDVAFSFQFLPSPLSFWKRVRNMCSANSVSRCSREANSLAGSKAQFPMRHMWGVLLQKHLHGNGARNFAAIAQWEWPDFHLWFEWSKRLSQRRAKNPSGSSRHSIGPMLQPLKANPWQGAPYFPSNLWTQSHCSRASCMICRIFLRIISLTGFSQKSFMVGMMVLYLLSAGKGMGFTIALCCLSH